MGSLRCRGPIRRLAAAIAVAAAGLTAMVAADDPRPGDDATYRPTVMIHQDRSIGTGTIIASVEDETLILTAWHVVAGSGPLSVEVNRFNMGMERVRGLSGFPKRVDAAVVVKDVDTDLAILRVRGELAFPFVARIGKGDAPPTAGANVTSIGFDGGAKLIGFATRVRAVERIDLGRGGGFRSFVVTDDPPELGRSGGGLFRADGTLVGVCLARAEPPDRRARGLFSTIGNVRALIRADEAVAAAMARADRKALAASRAR